MGTIIKCKENISSSTQIPLESIKDHVDSFPFEIFKHKPIIEVIDEHSKTICYAPRFGGGLKPYPSDLTPPSVVDPRESRYVEQLDEAYADDARKRKKPQNSQSYKEHLQRSRERYYSAETLKQFARENLPKESGFCTVEDEVLDTIIDTIEDEHETALVRVNKATDKSTEAKIGNHPLKDFLKTKALRGVCHQLANEDRVTWVVSND